jgi:hypothetical protein
MTEQQSKPESLPNPTPPPAGWPTPMKPEAMHGISGEIVKVVRPHTESDPAGLVLQNLTAFGNVVGNDPHFVVEADRHALNLFVAEVGLSAKGRKGAGWGQIEALYKRTDPKWVEDRIQTGLRTGEGLVQAVRDGADGESGVLDKRLLAFESEMGAVLRVMARPRNTLSTTLRQAWDGRTLRVGTRQSPLKATRPHISIIAHSTQDDLSRFLDRTDIFNGFANRFLWGCVYRSKLLPEGGRVPERKFEALVSKLKSAIEFAKTVREIRLSQRSREMWREEYPTLTADVPGTLGAVTSRAEPQVRRIAAIYALMDERDEVRTQHLHAALAVWKFCFESAKYIFGRRSPIGLDDKLRRVLREARAGMTRTEISAALNHHFAGSEIGSSLERLQEEGFATPKKEATKGRTAERWFAVSNGDV